MGGRAPRTPPGRGGADLTRTVRCAARTWTRGRTAWAPGPGCAALARTPGHRTARRAGGGRAVRRTALASGQPPGSGPGRMPGSAPSPTAALDQGRTLASGRGLTPGSAQDHARTSGVGPPEGRARTRAHAGLRGTAVALWMTHARNPDQQASLATPGASGPLGKLWTRSQRQAPVSLPSAWVRRAAREPARAQQARPAPAPMARVPMTRAPMVRATIWTPRPTPPAPLSPARPNGASPAAAAAGCSVAGPVAVISPVAVAGPMRMTPQRSMTSLAREARVTCLAGVTPRAHVT
jgi:hypothetical protein